MGMNPVEGMKLISSVFSAIKGVGGKKVVDLTSRQWAQIGQKAFKAIPTDVLVKQGASVAEINASRALAGQLGKDGKALEGFVNAMSGKEVFGQNGRLTQAGRTFVKERLHKYLGLREGATVFETIFAALKKQAELKEKALKESIAKLRKLPKPKVPVIKKRKDNVLDKIKNKINATVQNGKTPKSYDPSRVEKIKKLSEPLHVEKTKKG